MNKKDIQFLFLKYKAGNCTEDEKRLLESWYLHYEDPDAVLSEHDREKDLEEIRASLFGEADRRPVRTLFSKAAAVAAVVLLLATAAWFTITRKLPELHPVAKVNNHEIRPGSNKAYLTLADGSVIILDDATKGAVAEQTGIVIKKTRDGQLEYILNETSPPLRNQPVKFNTIATPRGGQYQVTLPDGTRVWLNALSSLRYPTYFTGDERKVELTGEAYFEVATNKNMPFRISANNQVVEVLGTRFNINSYTDEQATKTTLLEGSVRIMNLSSRTSNLLKTGQQAVISQQGSKIVSVDTDEAVAWKNGYILFENEKITSIMKKISRWYDVDIVYEGNITDSEFNGSVSRFDHVSKVLEILELTKSVHFKVQGRRIIVMP